MPLRVMQGRRSPCPWYLRDSTRACGHGFCSFGASPRHAGGEDSPVGFLTMAVLNLSVYGSLRLRWPPACGGALLPWQHYPRWATVLPIGECQTVLRARARARAASTTERFLSSSAGSVILEWPVRSAAALSKDSSCRLASFPLSDNLRVLRFA